MAVVHYTEYAGVRHNSWNKAYADPELTKWLLAKSLAAAIAKKSRPENLSNRKMTARRRFFRAARSPETALNYFL
jgi:hypothetical protein